MKRLYLGKTIHLDKECLIISDGIQYAPIPSVCSLDKLLQLTRDEVLGFSKLPLEHTLLNFDENFLENQKIWGTGLSYKWSKEKIERMDDSSIHKKIYFSERPMFFIKGDRYNHSHMSRNIGIRTDSKINIPEAELVALSNAHGELIGFSIGNDQTALSLELENPLFQLQAKNYLYSHSFLPLILLAESMVEIDISLNVKRNNQNILNLNYTTNNFKNNIHDTISYLFRKNSHPFGIFLFLGFNCDFPNGFTLLEGDEITISSSFFPITLIQKCTSL